MKCFLVEMVYYKQKFLVRATSKYNAMKKCIEALASAGKGSFSVFDFEVYHRPKSQMPTEDVRWL